MALRVGGMRKKDLGNKTATLYIIHNVLDSSTQSLLCFLIMNEQNDTHVFTHVKFVRCLDNNINIFLST